MHLHENNIARNALFLLTALLLVSCGAKATATQKPADQTAQPFTSTIFNSKNTTPADASRLEDDRPNIIFILTDDQPPSSLQVLPTIRKELMAKGVVFNKGFVTTPLCCPSRVSILCGEYTHNHLVKTDRAPLGGATAFDDSNTIGVMMQGLGYQTSYIGKYLNEYNDLKPFGKVPPGWSDWQVLLQRNNPTFSFYYDYSMSENGKVVDYPKTGPTYSTDLITQKAVDYINTNKNKPFFLFLGYFGPHSPYTSANRHKNEFRVGSALEWTPNRPPSFNEPDISDKPKYLQELIKPYSEKDLDAAHKQVLRALLSVDDGVTSILNTLDQTSLSKNTIIFFLSDNGLTIGEHGFGLDKECAYDECSHIPYIVYGPGYFQPRVDDQNMVANIDILPTILELAGGTSPKTVDGVSLLPLLNNNAETWRNSLLIEHWPDVSLDEGGVGAMIPEFYAIRTNEWKYVEYITGETELYDLINDPFELVNETNTTKYASIKNQLAKDLLELKK